MQSGFLLIDKQPGPTSHDIVNRLRRITGIKKIGHAGTLDPFASGLLLMAIGRESTREISKFVGLGKTYHAEITLGATTETLDIEADVILDENRYPHTLEEIRRAVQPLIGEIEQIPPMYSAIKKNGKKLYQLAREGKTIEREPRKMTITRFDITHVEPGPNGTTLATAIIECSSGTYVRALARDLGAELNTTGYLTSLRRTHIDTYDVAGAVTTKDLTPENWNGRLFHPQFLDSQA